MTSQKKRELLPFDGLVKVCIAAIDGKYAASGTPYLTVFFESTEEDLPYPYSMTLSIPLILYRGKRTQLLAFVHMTRLPRSLLEGRDISLPSQLTECANAVFAHVRDGTYYVEVRRIPWESSSRTTVHRLVTAQEYQTAKSLSVHRRALPPVAYVNEESWRRKHREHEPAESLSSILERAKHGPPKWKTPPLRCLGCDAEIDIPQPSGASVCTPCWIIKTRLQRMLLGWEVDVYAHHRALYIGEAPSQTRRRGAG